MRTAGLIGGIAPESTVEYYRFLIREYQGRVHDGSYPPVLINSIDMTRMLRLIQDRQLEAVTDYLSGEILKLARAGADFAVLASNTPHIVFEQLRARSPVPMVSIVEAACEAATALGLKRVGLFGTRSTMQAGFYPAVFEPRGISVLLPAPAEQAYVHEKYMGELVKGVFVDETRSKLLAIAARMRAEEKIDGLILGGTELPLLLRDAPEPPVSLLDTTTIHVKRIVAEMLS